MTQKPRDLKPLAEGIALGSRQGDMGRLSCPDQREEETLLPLPLCGDFDFTIHRDGRWSYRGSPVGRPALVRLFASVLRRVGEEYWLVTPYEQGRIRVEDAPFVAPLCRRVPQGLLFTTNLDEEILAGPDHPIRIAWADSGEPRPYILVRQGLEALIARPVFYDLAEWAVERDGRLGVESNGMFFPLEPAAD